jgi:hypothetical protein
VSNTELLEKILAAKYDLETADRSAKAACLIRVDQLLDEARAGTDISRHELHAALHDRYIAYRRARRQNEKLQIARKLGQKP